METLGWLHKQNQIAHTEFVDACKMVETLTHISHYNEHVIWHYINAWAKRIHSFHRPTNDYEGHTLCASELTKNSSQKTYMEVKCQYKGRQPHVDMIACCVHVQVMILHL